MKRNMLVFKAIALAMGVSTLVLNVLTEVSTNTTAILLSLGVSCLAIVQLEDS